jgi:hypothetical protein
MARPIRRWSRSFSSVSRGNWGSRSPVLIRCNFTESFKMNSSIVLPWGSRVRVDSEIAVTSELG